MKNEEGGAAFPNDFQNKERHARPFSERARMAQKKFLVCNNVNSGYLPFAVGRTAIIFQC